jgi:serine/threonine protein kinase
MLFKSFFAGKVLHGESETVNNENSCGDAQVDAKNTLENYELIKVLGVGCMGKVLLAREKGSNKKYAIKSISKKFVISHGKTEVEHTLTEQRVLATLSQLNHPFLIRLHASFQSDTNLFLVMPYIQGGDFATQLALYGSLDVKRAQFYCAEMVSGICELHKHGIIYRDLKPENVLLDMNGHIKLTDFGLSKQFKLSQNSSAVTFCGTAEYLAPEILKELPYSYEVDWWSLGTFLFELITGFTPFWAENHMAMYQRVLYDSLEFPADFFRRSDNYVLLEHAKDLITGLLVKDPASRLGSGLDAEQHIRNHPFFSDIDFEKLDKKEIKPPFVPQVTGEDDLRWFDTEFTKMTPKLSPPSVPQVYGENVFKGYTFLSTSAQRMMARNSVMSSGKKRRRVYSTVIEEEDEQESPTKAHEVFVGGLPMSLEDRGKENFLDFDMEI